tara:strand:- start:147 stop:1073 length:927 start_codon:yes stop_codon:yes gene_type:complete
MLKNTFIHISKLGQKTEENIWKNNILDWDDFINNNPNFLSDKKNIQICEELNKSKLNIKDNNPNFFIQNLPSNEHWRIFDEFRDSLVYLDIETTGLSFDDKITTIACYDGKNVECFIRGKNLKDFIDYIKNYSTIVTYNGKSFDVPFIESQFNIKLNHAHLDLRYILFSLGYKGGLKGCEKQLNIDRKDLIDIDGYFAVLLWNEYKDNNNNKALETLLAYNIEDTINLEKLMEISFNKKIKKYPFLNLNKTYINERPYHSFKLDKRLIQKMKKKYSDNYSISFGVEFEEEYSEEKETSLIKSFKNWFK